MADLDWGALIGQGLQAVTGYVNNTMQLKQAKKMAKAMAPTFGGGGGYGAMQFSGGVPQLPTGASSSMGGIMGGLAGAAIPSAMQLLGFGDTSLQSPLGQAVDYLQGQNCQKFKASTGQRVSPISLISDVNPATGRTHWWRHVGQPILFSGDVSHCRRVNKLLSKQTRRCGSRKGR